MASTELPPFSFADGGLRISLFPPTDVLVSDTPDGSRDSCVEIDSYKPNPHMADEEESPAQNIPEHPIPSLQDAFAESLLEVTNGTIAKPKLKDLGAKGRRELLISQHRDAKPFDSVWRYRPSQHEHEVFKLVSQISFGVYLLLNGMANSNSQVVNILQGHIDEVDEFLEVVLEDLAQATTDLTSRIEHLQLPMTNMRVFEELLEDGKFRAEILSGNEKIEHILARTNCIMKQWDEDIESGLSCTAAFTSWLGDQKDGTWRTEQPDLADVYEAMEGNVDGWLNAFDDMSDRAHDVNSLIIRLMTIIAEMEKMASSVSRRTWNADASSSMSSPPSSFQSNNTSMHQASFNNGSVTTVQPVGSDDDEDDGSDEIDYPLPGGLPLLPPTISPARSVPPPDTALTSRSFTAAQRQSARLSAHRQGTPSNSSVGGPPLLLQPRTYSPAPSASSLSSSMLREAPSFTVKPASLSSQRFDTQSQRSDSVLLTKKPSLRQRVSNPPEAIRIPPRSIADMPGYQHMHGGITPQKSSPQLYDSAYASDVESRNNHSRNGSNLDVSPPRALSNVIPSPRSDHSHQYYHPVRASPHSPLQQRPHTAAGPGRPYAYAPQLERNQPSQLSGMSTLSNVTMASYNNRTSTPSTDAGSGDRTLKKKKSAFGWFKKAFSMDDEERAAFEARKASQHQDRYHDYNTPKFLDGKRLR